MTDPRFTTAKPTGSEADRLRAGVGAMMTAARERAGLTRAELARRAGVGAPTLAKIERGQQRPSWRTLAAVAAAVYLGDPVRARQLADDLADAAGPSLAAPPGLPYSVAREAVVAVLTRSASVLGFDLDDDEVRAVVAEQIRAVVGTEQPREVRPAVGAFAGDAGTQNGGQA